MYNQEIKEKYLASLSSETNELLIVSVLSRVGKYESSLEKDVGEFSKAEVESFLLGMKKAKARTLYNYSSILRNYVTWYKQNIKQGEHNNIWKFTTKELEDKLSQQTGVSKKLDSKQYIKENKVIRDKDTLFSKDAIDYIVSIQKEPVHKLIIYSLYHGISGKSLIELTTLSQSSIINQTEWQLLDLDGDIITEGRKIQVPEYLTELLVQSCNSYQMEEVFSYKGSLRKRERKLYGPYGIKVAVEENEIMTLGSKCTEIWVKNHYRLIQNRLDNVILFGENISLTTSILLTSGFINTVKMYGEMFNLTPNEVLSHPCFEKISRQYGKYGQDIAQIRYTYKKYLY